MTKKNDITVDLPKMTRMADVVPSSFDAESRTFEVVFSTGSRGRRRGFFSDDWFEELSMDPKHVRMDRLQSGSAPFLNAHQQYGLGGVIGVIESARLEGGKGYAKVRLSKREDVDPIAKDVEDGILRNISIGYNVHKFERLKDEEEDLKIFRAVDWEPGEVSLVAMGFDPGAKIRSSEGPEPESTPCVFEGARGLEAKEGSEMATDKNKDGEPPEAPKTRTVTFSKSDVDSAVKEAQKAASKAGIEGERSRAEGIAKRCKALNLTDEQASDLISRGVDGDALKEALLDLAAERGSEPTSNQVQVGEQEQDKLRDAITEALEHRTGLRDHKDLSAAGREVRGMDIMRMGEELMIRQGHKFANHARMEMARDILGAQGTGSFPKILENIANKNLLKEYGSAPSTWEALATRSTASDFKEMARVRFSDLDELKLVNEHGEFERGYLAEEGEKYSVKTYGRIYSLSRQAMVNDDVSAFSRIPRGVARIVRRKRSDLAWALITGNVVMGDGVALFHNGSHGNDLGAAQALSIATLKLVRQKLRIQQNLKGDYLNLGMASLIVPTTMESAAEELIAPINPDAVGNVNIFRDLIRSVIVEPRLDALGAWYVSASMNEVDLFEYATLSDDGGPVLEMKQGFGVDGIEYKIRDDFGVAMLDYRGLQRANV